MAVDRLFSWRTPYSLSHDKSLLAELPPALAQSAKMSITGAQAASLRSTYAAGLLRFSQFCDTWQISESARMPASYALLCTFFGNLPLGGSSDPGFPVSVPGILLITPLGMAMTNGYKWPRSLRIKKDRDTNTPFMLPSL